MQFVRHCLGQDRNDDDSDSDEDSDDFDDQMDDGGSSFESDGSNDDCRGDTRSVHAWERLPCYERLRRQVHNGGTFTATDCDSSANTLGIVDLDEWQAKAADMSHMELRNERQRLEQLVRAQQERLRVEEEKVRRVQALIARSGTTKDQGNSNSDKIALDEDEKAEQPAAGPDGRDFDKGSQETILDAWTLDSLWSDEDESEDDDDNDDDTDSDHSSAKLELHHATDSTSSSSTESDAANGGMVRVVVLETHTAR